MTIRLYIDGNWDAADFAAFFKSLDDLHNHISLVLERDYHPEFGRVYAFGSRKFPVDARYRLKVSKVQFASPGFTDIVGLAAVMREIRELIQFVVTYASQRTDRTLKREKDRLEIARAKLEILERVYHISREYGAGVPLEAEMHFGLKSNALPDVDALIQAALDGRLTGVENLDTDS